MRSSFTAKSHAVRAAEEAGKIFHDYEPWGAAGELFKCKDPEVLIEGPAGTGKTRAVLEYINWLCESYPKIRVLIFRKTRSSMTESVLVTWEEKVLWEGHPAITGESGRESRRSYTYPNGSHVVTGGMDRSSRIMSTEWDLIACFEANEIFEGEWEAALSRLRNHVLPWQQAIADTNPDSEFHWLNQRAGLNKMTRLLSRHEDNPTVTPEYLDRLRALSGVRRERLYLGRWVSAEGQIFENFDPKVHMVDQWDVPPINWYFGSVDWGFRAPGVFQVWGVDENNCIYRVAEVYRTGKQIDWWADVICDLHQEYNLASIACDPAEPGSIEKLNDRIGHSMGRSMSRIAQKANNDLQSGLDQIRWGMSYDEELESPRLFLVRDALREGRDTELANKSKPTCTEQEIPSYIWIQSADGKPVKEKPDPSSADHGCDAMRYAAQFAWKRDLSELKPTFRFEDGSLGDVLNHQEVYDFEV